MFDIYWTPTMCKVLLCDTQLEHSHWSLLLHIYKDGYLIVQNGIWELKETLEIMY